MANLTAAGLQPLSCLRCAHKKIKCDRIDPCCSNCEKVRQQCEYRTGQPYKRRKKRQRPAESLTNEELRARLGRYEATLKSLGADVSTLAVSNGAQAQHGNDRPKHGRDAEADPMADPIADPAKASAWAGVKDTTTSATRGQLLVHQGKSRYVEAYGAPSLHYPRDDI